MLCTWLFILGMKRVRLIPKDIGPLVSHIIGIKVAIHHQPFHVNRHKQGRSLYNMPYCILYPCCYCYKIINGGLYFS